MTKHIILVLFLILGLAACGERAHQDQGRGNQSRNRGRQKGRLHLATDSVQEVGIRTEKAAYRECRAFLKAMGKIITPQPAMAIVSYAFPGRIAEGHVRPGEWVRKGDPLVTLESEEVGKAMSEFFKATADSTLAKANFEREQRLFENGVGAKKNFLSSEADYKNSLSNLEEAEKKLHVLGFTEEQVKKISDTHQVSPRITLYSPIAGKVAVSHIIMGAMTEPATEILRIIDPSILWIDAEVYEKDISCVKLGQEVDISVPAYPQEKFSGQITYVGDLLNEETRSITVRTEVENRQSMLKPGMFADLFIRMNGQHRLLAVPVDAILEEGENKIVFVQEGDQYLQRVVETGALDDGYQEIVKGLSAGENVVIQGQHQLKSKLEEDVLKAAHVH